ncbi:hypothetical protein CAEBREN_22545 [Caenorhabditis brenneri]|uniref:Uncharacterized protein n=1 Tax=Caenorhabditis brenneri TaxID=135651 RepID=G0MSX3_CAEBE|nr:hypothetical protein CAEBREN_22545 [Caenorhabditis brenneri]
MVSYSIASESCNVCQKVYDNTCQGFGIPNLLQWCPTAAEAGIEYTLGLISSLIPFIPAGSCGTIVTCPLTTTLKIKLFGSEIPAPVFYAWCQESGASAGKWYTGISWLVRFELVSLACKPILSG